MPETHPYVIMDVFTHKALSGNPLAVVFDADDISSADMGRIAREFNLSETVFICGPENNAHSARLRIFTPMRELPFAGHPTVGAAIALAQRNTMVGDVDQLLVFEEEIGRIRCAVRGGEKWYGEFDLPIMARVLDSEISKQNIAAALGLGEEDIGFENHEITVVVAGNAFAFVPLSGLDAAARIRVDTAGLANALPDIEGEPVECFAYTRDTINHDCAFHARMMAPHMGIAEDPATGSAVAAFSQIVRIFDGFADGPSEIWVEQGIEMGRPSKIRLEVNAKGGAIQSVRIGGHAVKVAQGTLLL